MRQYLGLAPHQGTVLNRLQQPVEELSPPSLGPFSVEVAPALLPPATSPGLPGTEPAFARSSTVVMHQQTNLSGLVESLEVMGAALSARELRQYMAAPTNGRPGKCCLLADVLLQLYQCLMRELRKS